MYSCLGCLELPSQGIKSSAPQDCILLEEVPFYNSHEEGLKSLVGYSPWGRKELDTT